MLRETDSLVGHHPFTFSLTTFRTLNNVIMTYRNVVDSRRSAFTQPIRTFCDVGIESLNINACTSLFRIYVIRSIISLLVCRGA